MKTSRQRVVLAALVVAFVAVGVAAAGLNRN